MVNVGIEVVVLLYIAGTYLMYEGAVADGKADKRSYLFMAFWPVYSLALGVDRLLSKIKRGK